MHRHLTPTLVLLAVSGYLVAEPVSFVNHLPPVVANPIWIFLGLVAVGVLLAVPRYLRAMTDEDFLFPPVPTAVLVAGLLLPVLMPRIFPGLPDSYAAVFFFILRWVAGMTGITYVACVGARGAHGSIAFGQVLGQLGGVVGLGLVKRRDELDAAMPENPGAPLLQVAVILCLFVLVSTRFNFKAFDARPEKRPVEPVGAEGKRERDPHIDAPVHRDPHWEMFHVFQPIHPFVGSEKR